MKTNIHANIGIVSDLGKLKASYFSNFHSFMVISGSFA